MACIAHTIAQREASDRCRTLTPPDERAGTGKGRHFCDEVGMGEVREVRRVVERRPWDWLQQAAFDSIEVVVLVEGFVRLDVE
jgi:hypothetical protein